MTDQADHFHGTPQQAGDHMEQTEQASHTTTSTPTTIDDRPRVVDQSRIPSSSAMSSRVTARRAPIRRAPRWYGPSMSLRQPSPELIERTDLQGDAFCRAYSAAADEWLTGLFDEATGGDPRGMALVAVGGYGRGELCPFSDLDVVLVHKGRKDVVGHRRPHLVPGVGRGDLPRPQRAATRPRSSTWPARTCGWPSGLLDARVICGESKVAEPVLEGARDRWVRQKPPWLGVLAEPGGRAPRLQRGRRLPARARPEGVPRRPPGHRRPDRHDAGGPGAGRLRRHRGHRGRPGRC